MTKSRPASTLRLEVAEVVVAERRLDVALGVAGAADAEVVVALADEAHQLRGVAEAARRRVELALPGRRVAAEGEHVLDAHRQELLHQIAQLLAGVPDAGEVGHGLEAGGADLLDQVDRRGPGCCPRRRR